MKGRVVLHWELQRVFEEASADVVEKADGLYFDTAGPVIEAFMDSDYVFVPANTTVAIGGSQVAVTLLLEECPNTLPIQLGLEAANTVEITDVCRTRYGQ